MWTILCGQSCVDNLVWTILFGQCCVDSIVIIKNKAAAAAAAFYLGESSFWENLTKRCFCRKILPNIWENHHFGRIWLKGVSVGKFSQKFGRIVNLGELTERCVSVGKFSQIFGRIFTISPKYLGESSLFLPKIWENLHNFSQIFGRIQCSSAVAAAAGMLL